MAKSSIKVKDAKGRNHNVDLDLAKSTIADALTEAGDKREGGITLSINGTRYSGEDTRTLQELGVTEGTVIELDGTPA
jgi:hypothetical protein